MSNTVELSFTKTPNQIDGRRRNRLLQRIGSLSVIPALVATVAVSACGRNVYGEEAWATGCMVGEAAQKHYKTTFASMHCWAEAAGEQPPANTPVGDFARRLQAAGFKLVWVEGQEADAKFHGGTGCPDVLFNETDSGPSPSHIGWDISFASSPPDAVSVPPNSTATQVWRIEEGKMVCTKF